MTQLNRENKAHKTHHLKIYPEHFSAVLTGIKRAELRKNDRDYKVGDTLHLMETPKGSCSPTGEFVNTVVTHIADVGDWLPGYVLLSIEREPAYGEPVNQPYGYVHKSLYEDLGSAVLTNDHEAYRDSRTHIPLYTDPQPVAVPVCPKCGNTGMADSGGVQPWGEPIEIPCDCRDTMLKPTPLISESVPMLSLSRVEQPVAVPEVEICDMCGHDAWNQGGRTYECAEGHRFEVRVPKTEPGSQPYTLPSELLAAMEEVLRISDRDHEAWHRARDGIAAYRAAPQEQTKC